MKPALLLHVGYHKTATTWMQRLLFTPEHGYRQIASHREAFDHVVRPHGLNFDPRPMREALAQGMSGLAAEETPVLSSEVLSGHPFYGGRESDVYAERLHRIVPEARILLTIRNQMRILPSVYMQYVLRGGTMPPDLFFAGTREPGYFGFAPEHFEYDRLVARYQDLFGAENVLVTTQESLLKDLEATASRIAAFAGNPLFAGLSATASRVQAPSYPEYAAPILRRLNHVQRSTLNSQPIVALGTTPGGLYKVAGYVLRRQPLRGLLRGRKPVSDVVERRFATAFSSSNARLGAMAQHPLDLSSYP